MSSLCKHTFRFWKKIGDWTYVECSKCGMTKSSSSYLEGISIHYEDENVLDLGEGPGK